MWFIDSPVSHPQELNPFCSVKTAVDLTAEVIQQHSVLLICESMPLNDLLKWAAPSLGKGGETFSWASWKKRAQTVVCWVGDEILQGITINHHNQYNGQYPANFFRGANDSSGDSWGGNTSWGEAGGMYCVFATDVFSVGEHEGMKVEGGEMEVGPKRIRHISFQILITLFLGIVKGSFGRAPRDCGDGFQDAEFCSVLVEFGWICKTQTTRWFKMTFSSPGPSWRSLNPLKGPLNHPKKVTLNHQVYHLTIS